MDLSLLDQEKHRCKERAVLEEIMVLVKGLEKNIIDLENVLGRTVITRSFRYHIHQIRKNYQIVEEK